MEAKEYSIMTSTETFSNGVDHQKDIYNIKLTEELVKKLMKGQKDLNNLNGIEFSISNKGGIDVIHHILLCIFIVFCRN